MNTKHLNEALITLKAGTANQQQYDMIEKYALNCLHTFNYSYEEKQDLVIESMTKFHYSDYTEDKSLPITYFTTVVKNEAINYNIKINGTTVRIPKNNIVRESNTIVNGELLSIFDIIADDSVDIISLLSPEIDSNALLEQIDTLILEHDLKFVRDVVYNDLSYKDLMVKYDMNEHTVKNKVRSDKQKLKLLLTGTNDYVKQYNKIKNDPDKLKEKAVKAKKNYDPVKAKYYRDLYKQNKK